MVAIAQGVFHLLAQERGAQRETGAEPLGRGDHVGLDAEVHIAVEHAAAAVADLHLVAHEQNIPLLAECRDALHKGFLQRDHAALALDDLDEDARHRISVQLGLHVRQIIDLGVDKAGGQGLEVLVELVLAGGSQGGESAAVEGVLQGENIIAVLALLPCGVLPRHLDGALVGLGAGVGEEDLLHAGSLAEHFGQNGAGLGVIKIGGVLELAHLGDDGLLPGLVRHAEGVDGDSGAQVDVFFSVSIHHHGALAGDDLHREAVVGIGHVLVIQRFDIHERMLLSGRRPMTVEPGKTIYRTYS